MVRTVTTVHIFGDSAMADVVLHRANRILGALPQAELDALLPHLSVVPLQRDTILIREGERLSHIYFPHRGVVSQMLLMHNGETAEVTTVGPEGLVGFAAVLGRTHADARKITQIAGSASCIPTSHLLEAMGEGTCLRRLIFLYLNAFLRQTCYFVACNALHSVEERAARWLLMVHDKALQDTFDITQEYLAEMLAVRRASVNLVCRTFQQGGLIRYRRGVIQILDRPGLEELSCECYQTIRDIFDELFISER